MAVSDAAERGKRDNYFLAHVILGQVYPDLTEHFHKPLCDFFVKKNSNKPFSQQDTVKNRLLMAGRGHYKTSLDLVDCVSWMLNFPNVTILMLSGSQDVATRMVEELKQIFLSCEDFRALYPAFIPIDNVREFGAKGEFWLPRNVRTRIRREPTISISTLDSVKASTHYDIRVADDVVDEINSRFNPNAKIDQNEKVASEWNATRPLLNPGGYTQVIGTFYNFACMYGKILDRLELTDSLAFGQSLETTTKGWKVAIYPSITPDENGNLFNSKGIYFPEKFCVNATTPEESIANADKFNLQEAWEEDPEHFNAQYMNYPIGTQRDYFPIDLLRKQTIPRDKIPMRSMIFAAWDLAYRTNQKNDYTVGAVGAFDDQGNIYIIDLFRGRWKPPQIIENIIACWRKWPLQRIGIEQSIGVPLLGPGLNMRMRELGLAISFDWLKVSNKKDSTINEILALSTLLGKTDAPKSGTIEVFSPSEKLIPTGKLFFSADLPQLADLYVEFARYGGGHPHDDIPRAVSLLMRYFGQGISTNVGGGMNDPIEIGGARCYSEDMVDCIGSGIVG